MLKNLFASNKRPYFRNLGPWETRTFDLSGCKIEITLPPHDFDFPEEDHGTTFNVFDPDIYDYDTEPNNEGIEPTYKGVSSPIIFSRKWNTFGPIWRGSPLGFLQCSLAVCDISRMNTELNCFNPEHLERLIIHGLYHNKGPGFSKTNEFTTPLNWEIKTVHGIDWVYFESWPRVPEWQKFPRPGNAAHFTPCLVAPLFADKYLNFAFSATGSLPAEPSIHLMLDRIQRIIPSIKLSLSTEAEKQKNAAIQQNPHVKYSPRREPEAWKYYGSFRQGDLYAGEKEIVFEGQCSPPPSLDIR